ncbi:hypothetical protein C4J95_2451 [Pseudomonas orientalis]|uniref:hypothetical protein n=1 Tax=Pseudomonas orientalis TaxID=76758 RepID=UPI000F6C490D|nr:hypothetical protein [Pseudomonas orientalis]AZE99913.1 hypothetical protein C4J95_2451 [Pseudomonas orientalis]
MSKYMHLHSFMYEVGEGVGEFLSDDEKKYFQPLTLSEIVKNSFGKGGVLSLVHALILKKQIAHYIRSHMGAEGLEYVDPPFGQETSFAEDYFEGDLYTFLTGVMELLDSEMKARRRKLFFRLIGRR